MLEPGKRKTLFARTCERVGIRHCKVLLILTSLVAALAAYGVTPAGASHTLTVDIMNVSTPGSANWSALSSDLAHGEALEIVNGSGVVVASFSPIVSSSPQVLNVPVESVYKVVIGNLGSVSYSLAQVESDNWTVNINVG